MRPPWNPDFDADSWERSWFAESLYHSEPSGPGTGAGRLTILDLGSR